MKFIPREDAGSWEQPRWPRHEADRQVMLFDTRSRVAADPAGRARWRYWA